jgi:hypothetical protein
MAEEKGEEKLRVIQFQMPDPEGQEVSMYLVRIAKLKEQQKQLNASLIEAMMSSSTAFRSSWRAAKIKGDIPEDVDLPELFDIRTGKLQVDIEGSIATYRIPPEPERKGKKDKRREEDFEDYEYQDPR